MKLAIFWQFSQFNSKWEELYYKPTLNKIIESGLYDEIEFIDFFIKGNKFVKNPPDKLNNVHMFGTINEKHKEIASFWIDRIIKWSKENLGYKILLFHELGIVGNYESFSWLEYEVDVQSTKSKFKNFLERLSIEKWKLSVDLLDYHDVVGGVWHEHAVFYNDDFTELYKFDFPHYHGGPFYWTTSDYFSTLDVNFLKQKLDREGWRPYLGELIIGSKNPNYYSLISYDKDKPFNQYESDIDEWCNVDALIEKSVKYLNDKKIVQSIL